MARQAVKKTTVETPETPPAAAANKPEKAPKTQKKRVFDYTKYRLAFHNPADFQQYLAGYPDTTGLMGYAYRLTPKIDFGLVGRQESNIHETRLFSEMTNEFMAKQFGRGRYMLKLTDANRPKGQQEVARTWFLLDDEEKAPVYDVRTLVLGHAENQDEVNRLIASNVLVRDVNGAPRIRVDSDGRPVQPYGGGNGGGGAGELIGRDFIGQLLLKLVTQGVESPQDRLKQSIEIAKLMQPTGAQLSPDQLAEMVAAKLGGNPATAGTGDIFDNWERVEKFFVKARGENGAGAVAAAGGKTNWVSEAAELLKGLAVAVPAIIEGAEYMRRMRMAGAGAGAVASALNGQAPAAGSSAPRSMIDRITEACTIGFARMNEGVSGFDFAGWLCLYHPGGLEVFRFLEPNGVMGVTSLIGMNPQTAPLLHDPVRRTQVETFLSQFFEYDPEGSAGGDDSADADEGDEAPAPAA